MQNPLFRVFSFFFTRNWTFHREYSFGSNERGIFLNVFTKQHKFSASNYEWCSSHFLNYSFVATTLSYRRLLYICKFACSRTIKGTLARCTTLETALKLFVMSFGTRSWWEGRIPPGKWMSCFVWASIAQCRRLLWILKNILAPRDLWERLKALRRSDVPNNLLFLVWNNFQSNSSAKMRRAATLSTWSDSSAVT